MSFTELMALKEANCGSTSDREFPKHTLPVTTLSSMKESLRRTIASDLSYLDNKFDTETEVYSNAERNSNGLLSMFERVNSPFVVVVVWKCGNKHTNKMQICFF